MKGKCGSTPSYMVRSGKAFALGHHLATTLERPGPTAKSRYTFESFRFFRISIASGTICVGRSLDHARTAGCSLRSVGIAACSSIVLLPLKLETQRRLHAAGRAGRDGPPEERRAQIAHRRPEVCVIQYVKRIHCNRRARSLFLALTLVLLVRVEEELLRPPQIKRDPSGPFQTISAHPGRAIVGKTVVVVVPTSSKTVRLPSLGTEHHTEFEESARVQCAVDIKRMPPVKAGSRPLPRKIIIVRGKRADAVGVVRDSLQRVHHDSLEKATQLALKSNF